MITLFIELMLRRREQVSPSYHSGHHKSFAWFKILGLTYTEEIEQKPNNNLTLFYLGEVFKTLPTMNLFAVVIWLGQGSPKLMTLFLFTLYEWDFKW